MTSPPALSVVIPAYNEETRLPPTLAEAVAYLENEGAPFEVIVVDDGSYDGTREVVHRVGSSNVRLIRLERNRGKGYAVRTGVLASKGDLVLFVDADGSTPFDQLKLLRRELTGDVEIAFGSRALRGEDTAVHARLHRKVLGRVFNLLVNLLAIPGVKDTQCGFKLFTRRAADTLFPHQTIDGFAFDVELLFLARQAGLKWREVPVSWRNVPGSKVDLFRDSLRMLSHLLRLRWRFTFKRGEPSSPR